MTFPLTYISIFKNVKVLQNIVNGKFVYNER